MRRVLALYLLVFAWQSNALARSTGPLRIHYLDSGIGTIVISPLREVILVDDGSGDRCDAAVSYLESLDVTGIDYYVTTANESDQSGCAASVLLTFPLKHGGERVRAGKERLIVLDRLSPDPIPMRFVRDMSGAWRIVPGSHTAVDIHDMREIHAAAVGSAPFGTFDTPLDGSSGLVGAIGITGWALDDTGVSRVVIERAAHPNDPSGAVVNGRVFIGNATFVNGARSDVAALYPSVPNASRSGWGYLMLTRGLVWDGQGAFNLYASAIDLDGNTTLLGTRRISVDNSKATKPFGSIDTPAQGDVVSGAFVNFGWVLALPGRTIPAANVRVGIDNVLLPQTSECLTDRSDITNGFPGFDTSQAIRCFTIDSTKFSNGLHSIGWLVTDNTGQADGIGSRFFTVQNPAPTGNRPPIISSVAVSPTGTGLMSATVFTFTGQGISDPDGDALTYSWTSSDGSAITSTTPSATHVYSNSGTFQMRLTVTDSKGQFASASATVTVGSVTGTWDVTCDNRSAEARRLWPTFPSVFVVTLFQAAGSLSGSMSGGGLSRNFTFPGTVSDPRKMVFGVETIGNVWADRDGDFYFHLALTDTLRSGTSVSGSFYCGSSVATKR